MNLRDAKEMALDLMREHGLRDVESKEKFWHFEFDRSRRRFGYCDYSKQKISLSRALTRLNDDARVRNTVLHEIAHALAEKGTGHGPAWRHIAFAIGCDGQRCYGESVVKPAAPWRAVCPKCGELKSTYHRRQKLLHRVCLAPLTYIRNGVRP